MDKFQAMDRKRKESDVRFAKLDSDVYRLFLQMSEAAFRDGALSRKHKELIAVAISVVTNCESCMQWHIREAKKAGATLQEVTEALEVAIEMGIGPVTVNARFALDVMEHNFGEIVSGTE